MLRPALAAGFLCLAALLCPAADPEPVRREWTVGGVKREALVYAPASKAPAPVVFFFHGHGGTMRNGANKFAAHKLWPEAVCVYMQGLPTPGKLTDPDGKRPGWQFAPGEQGDRDLHFFDAVLATLKKEHTIDEKRVYATGHSNGGRFTYVLWAARGDVFAAVAPSGTNAGTLLKGAKPKPCLHVAGEKDELVKFEWQKPTMEAVRKLNGCEAEGRPWDKAGALAGTLYPSEGGAPFVSLIYPGGHAFPDDGNRLIVKFFKEQAKK
jgi:polyhydroxybutyrate depolymerase